MSKLGKVLTDLLDKEIERLAIVGESKWQEGMASFCKPFTKAKIQYFDHAHIDAARQWVIEGT